MSGYSFFTDNTPHLEYESYEINYIYWERFDFEQFSNYGLNDGSKFECRMNAAKESNSILLQYAKNYDLIFVQHSIYLFHISPNEPIWEK